MGFNWGLAFAIGKAAHGVRKAVQGNLGSKDAGSAGLVDPTQAAMVNLMHRERRAMQSGTSDAAARGALSREGKNIIKRGILGGKRDISQYSKLRAESERAITEGRASERLGILKGLTDETRNMADRSMDLVELAGERKRVAGEATKQTGGKNLMAQLPALQDAVKGLGGNKAGDDQGDGKKKKNGENAAKVAKTVGGALKGLFGNKGGGSGGDSGGGLSSSGDSMMSGAAQGAQ